MTGADNQQERLASAESVNWFLAGFIEGEGALCVSIKSHPTCRSGFYVDPGFFLYQHESGRRLLELAQATFGSGAIYRKPGSERTLVFEISSTRVLREKVLPFLSGMSCRSAVRRQPSSASVRSWRRWSEVSIESPTVWLAS